MWFGLGYSCYCFCFHLLALCQVVGIQLNLLCVVMFMVVEFILVLAFIVGPKFDSEDIRLLTLIVLRNVAFLLDVGQEVISFVSLGVR